MARNIVQGRPFSSRVVTTSPRSHFIRILPARVIRFGVTAILAGRRRERHDHRFTILFFRLDDGDEEATVGRDVI